ncbi:MAG: ABC transporter permease [Acidimicrobiales bacterium]
MKPSVVRAPMQALAFVRKEIAEVVHQPRLLLTLVIGPFLVMAAFGAGYRDEPRRMRTVFVVPDQSPVRDRLDQYTEQLSTFVDPAGVTADEDAARRELARGDVDLVVVFPGDPVDDVLAGDRAVVTIVHTRLDPIERTAILFASDLAIGEVNSEVLAAVVGQGQQLSVPAAQAIAGGHDAVAMMRDAIAGGSDEQMATAIEQLDAAAADLRTSSDAATAIVDRLGDDAGRVDVAATIRSIDDLVAAVRADPQSSGPALDVLDRRLDEAASGLADFADADPDVLVRPLRAQVELAVSGVDAVADWYAPAAVVLMLQQFGIAFGSLSFVREKQLGITDVYRVAPVSAPPTVIGKYLAYLTMGMVVGAALMALVVGVLDVPLSGSVGAAAIVMALTLFASIGVGFVISLASRSDAQAVQYTMIALLASLFFSGFFLSSEQLSGPAAAIGWALPVTYGMRLLRDVMLRGHGLDREVLAAFVGYGVVVLVVATVAASRRMGVIRRR